MRQQLQAAQELPFGTNPARVLLNPLLIAFLSAASLQALHLGVPTTTTLARAGLGRQYVVVRGHLVYRELIRRTLACEDRNGRRIQVGEAAQR